MFGRHRRAFFSKLDRERVESAIRDAECRTTSDLRVVVLPHVRGPIARVAELTARKLGMTRSPRRNGVLILVLPRRREFYVWGDAAIHERVGDALWRSAADSLTESFRAGDFTGGLLAAIGRIGPELAAHFPSGPGAAGQPVAESVLEE